MMSIERARPDAEEELDARRRVVLDHWRRMNEAQRMGDRHRLREHLRSLQLYAEEHFAAEERTMAEHGYPDLNHHRRLHGLFSTRMQSLRAEVATRAGRHELRWIVAWYENHLRHEDRSVAGFLAELRPACTG